MADIKSDNLEKLNKKIDGLEIDEKLSSEIKAEIKDLLDNVSTGSVDARLEQLNTRLESIEENNKSLKDSVYNFVKSSSETLETITKSDSKSVPDKLKEYLYEIVGKIDGLKSSIPNNGLSENFDENQLKTLKKELNSFQEELEAALGRQLNDVGENVEKIVIEIKKQLEIFNDILDNNTEKLVMEVLSDIKQLRADSLELSGTVRKIDEKSEKITDDTLNKIIEQSKISNDRVVRELAAIRKLSPNPESLENRSKEAVETLKRELSVLQNNINSQIRDVLSKILVQDEIKFLCEETMSGIKSGNTEINIVQKHLKDIKISDDRQAALLAEMRKILDRFEEYLVSENSDKIDMIYDNMSFVNNWANSSDTIYQGLEDFYQDFEVASGKVDVIYENLTFINEWAKTFSKFSKDIEEIKNNCRDDINFPQKITEIYNSVLSVRDWSKKADALALQVKALSVQIEETENSVNTENLNEIKRLFAEMNSNIVSMNSKNYELFAETDKSNEIMQSQLKDLKTLISDFTQKPQNEGIWELTKKVDEIKDLSSKNTDFEQVVTESFGYLAEWIDAAGAVLNSLKRDIYSLRETSKAQSDLIEQIKNNPAEHPALPRILLEVQNISELMDKINKKENSKIHEVDFDGMRTLLEYILTEVTEQKRIPDENEKINMIAEKTENFANHYEVIADITGTIAENTEAISDKIETFESKMNFMENKMNSVENKINSFENKVSSFENKIYSFENKIDSFETKLSSVEKYMSKLIEYLEED